MKNEFNDLQNELNNKGHNLKINCNDIYFLLRKVLARDWEYAEKDADLKIKLSLVCISSNVLLNLLEYLRDLVKSTEVIETMNDNKNNRNDN